MSDILFPEKITETPATETRVEKFNVSINEITELKNKYTALTIDGIDDKEGYKVVDTARKDVKKKRVEIDNMRLALNVKANDYIKSNNSDAKQFIHILESIETDCEDKIKAIDDEKERLKEEEKRSAEALINSRVKLLIDAGCEFDGVSYSVAEVTITYNALKSIDESVFNVFYEKCWLENSRLEEIKANNERIAAEEKAEQEKLQKAEQERIISERKELEVLRAAQAIREQELTAERNKIEAEKSAIEKLKQDAENERVAQINIIKANEKRLADIAAAEVAATEREAQRFKLEADRAVIAAETARLEADRQASLAPDKDKLLTFGKLLGEIKIPEFTSDAAKAIFADIQGLVLKIQTHINKKVKEL